MKNEKIRIYEKEVTNRCGNYQTITSNEKDISNARLLCRDFLSTHTRYESKIDNTALYALLPVFKAYCPDSGTRLDKIIHNQITRLSDDDRKKVLSDAKAVFSPEKTSVKYRADKKSGCKLGHDKAEFIHPYLYNDTHEMYYSRNIKTFKGYWNTSLAIAIDKEAREYFYNYNNGTEKPRLKDSYESGKELLSDLYITGSISTITKGVIKSVARSGKLDDNGNWIPSNGSQACTDIMCNYYHDDIYSDLESAVILQLSSWLCDDNWYEYIIPDGNGWIEYKTYITPRSNKEMPYYMKLMSCVRSTLYAYSNKRITDLSNFMDKEERRQDTALDKANLILNRYETPYDLVESNQMVRSLVSYIDLQCKDKTASELRTLIKFRIDGMKDRDIARKCGWSDDKVKNLSRKLKQCVGAYSTEKRHWKRVNSK